MHSLVGNTPPAIWRRLRRRRRRRGRLSSSRLTFSRPRLIRTSARSRSLLDSLLFTPPCYLCHLAPGRALLWLVRERDAERGRRWGPRGQLRVCKLRGARERGREASSHVRREASASFWHEHV